MAGQRNISALRKLESLNDNDVFLVINKTGAESFEAKRMEWERVQVAVRAIVADFPRDTNTITVSKDVEGGILRFSVKDNTSTQKSIFHDGTNSSTRKEARFTSGPGIDVAVADNSSDDRADVTVKNTGVVDVASNTTALTLSTNTDDGKKITLGIDAGKIPINNFDSTSALAVESGGTGAKTAEDARKNVGAAQSGTNEDITELKALSTAITVAQGGTGADDADEGLANLKGLKEVKNAGNQGQSLIATESTNSNSVSYRAELKSISSQASSGIQVTTNGQVIEISSVPKDILQNLPEGATIDVNKVRFENASAPSKKDDLATRGYVDDLVANPDGGPVRVASTNEFRGTYIAANKHIVGVDELELFIDGVQLAVNDRVLLKDQSDQKLNGIYYVARTGSSTNNQQPILQRSEDALESKDIPAGRSVYVKEGKVNQASSFYQTTVDPIVDQKPLIFVSNTGLDVPVVVVSTNNIAATYNNSTKSLLLDAKARLIIDDYFLDTFDRVLFAGQTDKKQNGIYTVEARGGRNQQPLLTRASDALTSSDLRAGRSVYVKEGTDNKGKYFVQTQPSPIIGSGDLVFSLVSGGDGKADLSTSRDGTSVTIESSTGSNAVVGSASNSQAGVLTASDYVKLDDLAAGRNSSYLKSGAKAVDSDKLNNQEASFYQNADNIDAGTLNANRLPNIPEEKLPASVKNVPTNLTSTVANSYVQINSSTGDGVKIDYATTNRAGVISKDDYKKLDALDKGENTSYLKSGATAADSNKLNNQAASFYQNATNITDGTLDAERLPNIPEDKLPDSVKGGATNLTSTVGASFVQINSSTGDDVKIEYAFTNRAGVMSKDDWNKLDALDKGENTSYLKSDGKAADSGKLNNQEASFYQNADNIDAGTLNVARLPNIPEEKLPTNLLTTDSSIDASKVTSVEGSTLSTAVLPSGLSGLIKTSQIPAGELNLTNLGVQKDRRSTTLKILPSDWRFFAGYFVNEGQNYQNGLLVSCWANVKNKKYQGDSLRVGSVLRVGNKTTPISRESFRESFKVRNSGQVVIADTLDKTASLVCNGVISTNRGIQCDNLRLASSNSDLERYEKGPFKVTNSRAFPVADSIQTVDYIRIGDLVTITAQLKIQRPSSGSSDSISIDLPFVSDGVHDCAWSCSNWKGNNTYPGIAITKNNSAKIEFYFHSVKNDVGSRVPFLLKDIQPNSVLRFTLTYRCK